MLYDKIKNYATGLFKEAELIDWLFGHDAVSLMHNFKPKTKIVILGIFDCFLHDTLLNPINSNDQLISVTVRAMHALAQNNKETQFIVIQGNLFVERELSLLPACTNLHVVQSPLSMFIEYSAYCAMEPLTDKKLNSDRYIVCLNNVARPHRVGTVMYLIHKKLLDVSWVSMMTTKYLENGTAWDERVILDWADWDDNIIRNAFSEIRNNYSSYNFIKERILHASSSLIDCREQSTNNFKTKLTKFYTNTYVEIITETTCIEPSYLITEKFVNSLFAYNFFIIIGTYGAVSAIRDMGFDVYDDIIDHSYDFEKNPIYRIRKAIDLNYKLLIDKRKLEMLFVSNQPRFDANIHHYKNILFEQEFLKAKDRLDAISDII
jgi:hypothetical protein